MKPADVTEPLGTEFRRLAEVALEEDLRYGDDATTGATIPAGLVTEAEFTPRAPGVLAGIPAALAVLDLVCGDAFGTSGTGETFEVLECLDDGAVLTAGSPVLVVRGPARALLTAERTALNLLTHLSGVATLTAHWVAAVDGTGCVIRDTRKTLPGLRSAQKYAVRCGGGANHRLGLGDALLVKDNHIAAAGSVTAALKAARSAAAAPAGRALVCEIEVDDLDALDQALAGKAEVVLLDNFSVPDCAEAVRRTRSAGTGTLLEASGGLTLARAREYAETGVDYLAVGALTHSAPALDIGLDLRK